MVKNCVICYKKIKKYISVSQKTCSIKCSKKLKTLTFRNWVKRNKIKRQKYMLEYRKKNKEIIKKKEKEYYLNNRHYYIKKSKIYEKEHKQERKKYREKNKKHRAEYKRNYDKCHKKEQIDYRIKSRSIRNLRMKKYFKNPINRIVRNFRVRLWGLLKDKNKSKTTMELVGCSVEYLKKHLEKQFTKGMNWNNYGFYGWHIDHIRPCNSFDLSKKSEQIKCFNYKNLRPLWAEENLRRPKNIKQ